MRYLVTLEGQGGELDRREAKHADEIDAAVLSLVEECTFAPGDVIRIVDTAPEQG